MHPSMWVLEQQHLESPENEHSGLWGQGLSPGMLLLPLTCDLTASKPVQCDGEWNEKNRPSSDWEQCCSWVYSQRNTPRASWAGARRSLKLLPPPWEVLQVPAEDLVWQTPRAADLVPFPDQRKSEWADISVSCGSTAGWWCLIREQTSLALCKGHYQCGFLLTLLNFFSFAPYLRMTEQNVAGRVLPELLL